MSRRTRYTRLGPAFAGLVAGATAVAQPGRCCLPDATCATLTFAACLSANGIFYGSNSPCSSGPCGYAYAWTGGPVPIPDGSGTSTCGAEAILSVEVPAGAASPGIEASFYITHPNQGDLTITLEKVGGSSVVLIDRPGYPAAPLGFSTHDLGSGSENAGRFISTDYATAIYDNPATAGINNPTGRWRAQDSFSQFSLGTLPGTWRLRVKDCAAGQTGSVIAFTLLFRGSTRGLGCYPNCDNSTAPPCLNVNDFVCFLNAFATGEEYANCDDSYIPPHININDFICFMGSFAFGCSMPCSPRP